MKQWHMLRKTHMSQYATTTPLADRNRVSSHENEQRPNLVNDCILFSARSEIGP